MKPSHLTELLTHAIPSGTSILITGQPGVGKTTIVKAACALTEAAYFGTRPAIEDPTDAKGFPFPAPDGKTAQFLQFGTMAALRNHDGRAVLFADDLGQATPAVQAAYMAVMDTLPPHVTVIAATNRRTDRAGVTGILEPVKSRFTSIVELTVDLDEWVQWAFGNNIPAELIAFLRFRPDLLSAFEPSADMKNCPVPRTWAHLARLQNLNMSKSLENEAFAGAVGEGASAEYLAFRRTWAEMPSIDAIFIDPDAAKIPEAPATLYAVATAVGMRVDKNTFGRAAKYIARLASAGYGEFAALTLRDALRRESGIAATPDFVRLAAGPLGELIGSAKK